VPRLPVDGKKVVEHRITFGTKERDLLQDISTSYRIQAIDPEAMMKILEDPLRVIQIGYGLATAIEMLGFETGLPTIADLADWKQERKAKLEETKASVESGDRSIAQIAIDIGNVLTAGLYGMSLDELKRRTGE
jgi:hypothetical protein